MSTQPTFVLPQELIQPAIDAHINTAILTALDGKDGLVSKAVLSIIQSKVDSSGKPSTYRDSQPWIDWVMGEALKTATKNALSEHVAKYQKEIEAVLVSELSKKNSPLMKQLVRSMVGGIGHAMTSTYRFTVTVNGKE